MRLIVLALAALAVSSQAVRAEVPYLDDRSDAAQLVRSLYNAVNRREYARAFDYFTTPPAKSFAAYAKGYADTVSVDVLTGQVKADGVAGSVFYSVPTAIRAKDVNGNVRVFTGCYAVRAVNGTVQEPPSRPLQIESAKLKSAKEEDYTHYSLPDCQGGESVDGEAEPDDAALLAMARERFVREMAFDCDKAADTLGGAIDPQVYQIKYRPDYAGPDEPETAVTLFAFACSMAAYNSSEAYYTYEKNRGLRRVSFAAPNLDIKYSDEENRTLASMTVDGFTSDELLTNSEFDPESRSINHFAKWRGVGDASTSAEYAFKGGQFVLTRYTVDPTTDEEMNPYAIVREGKLLPSPELVPDAE